MTTLALIGVGRWGMNYLKTVKKVKDCQIKYIVAQNADTLLKFSNEYIKTCNYNDLFKYSDIDGVIIATPGSTHHEIIRKFIEKDYFILVEKPITTSYKEALSIKDLTKGRNPKIFVGHIYLYNPAYRLVKSLLPTIGQIRYILFKGNNFGPFRDDMSVLWEWMPHGVSICTDLLNNLPEEVSCWAIETLRPDTKLYDNVYVRLKFKNKVNTFLECGWLYPIKRRELVVCGSISTIAFDDLADKKVTLFKNLGPKIKDKKIIDKRLDISFPSYEITSSLEVELQEFVNFIKTGKHPETDLDQAVKIASIIDAAERSLENNGKPIKLIS